MLRSLLALCLAATLGCATGEGVPAADAGRDAATQRDAPGADVVDVAPQQDAGEPGEDVVAPPVDAGDLCRPNRDGVITRAEFPARVGATALYFVNRAAPVVGVDTAGSVVDGVRRWDYARPFGMDDQRVLDEVMPPSGQWWSSRFPDATFASVLDRATGVLGVYRLTTDALELLGSVSTEANRTLMTFSPAVAVLRFPLREGASWQQTVMGSGFVNLVPLVNSTTYTTRVDAAGEVWTPAARYPVLRVNTLLDQSIPATVFRVTRRTYAFVTECGGLVARVASTDNDTAEGFTRASEWRRLGL